ncbi:DUF3231 family protein [Caldalkalibacillus salinus]|uniref:DUF3231 family protein n=1 Tax=Caldalkalibacillus salinus TaxID=2803787 RepID=UPI0019204C15
MKTGKEQLTATEMGKLWATYVGNTLGKYVISYYLQHVDDKDIKKVLEYALGLSETYIEEIQAFFKQSNFPIPVGFTDDDVNLKAPRLFNDEFYLHYLTYVGKAGMSIYSVAIPLVTRKDIRDFFINCLRDTAHLASIVTDTLKSKNSLMNTPVIPAPKRVEFVTNQNYLNSFWGDKRPLHMLEITHLYGCINNDVTSKALIMGFSQGAKDEKVKKYLERGKNLNQKHIEMMSEKLTENNLPSPNLQDHLVTSSTVPPFSDKLMLYHKVDMFSMKVREYANGASLDGRKDVGTLFGKMQMDSAIYVEDGANIMIHNGEMEQIPLAVNRDELVSKS